MDEKRIERLKKAAADILDPNRVLVAYAFGSRVHGRPRQDSDLDVGYFLRKGTELERPSLREELDWGVKLTEAAGVEVDLRYLGNAPLDLRGTALIHGIRIFIANEEERVDLERYLLGMYHDYRDVYEKMHSDRLKVMAGKAID